MLDDVKANLVSLGLSSKQADVYLAMLQLGPASVQIIATKAEVNRSTTYLLLDELKARGLVSSFEKTGKVFFVAENPQRLMALTVNELTRVQDQQETVKMTLPYLLALFQTTGNQPRVRFFEGEEALHHAREEMIATREALWEVYAADENLLQVAAIRQTERLKLAARRSERRLLIAIKPGCQAAPFYPEGVEVRLIDYARCPFAGSVTVAGNKLCILTPQANGMGILVDSVDMANIFRALYETAWASAKSWAR